MLCAFTFTFTFSSEGSVSGTTTGEVEAETRGKAAFPGCNEARQRCGFIEFTCPLHRDLVGHVLDLLRRDLSYHLGPDYSRRDAIALPSASWFNLVRLDPGQLS